MSSSLYTTDELFPVPSSSPPSKLSPAIWPGVTPESTAELRKALKDNHERWHLYFHPDGFHNHAPHWVTALWALGADASIIEAAYKHDCTYQAPLPKSPEPITESNYHDHLGDDSYYAGYLEYFKAVLKEKGAKAALEEYIFATKANLDPTRPADKQPEMLNRFMDAIVHPMIHLGYGLEFDIPGMVVEGLASTAVHKSSSTSTITQPLYEGKQAKSRLRVLKDHLTTKGVNATVTPDSGDVHAFTILARMLKDPRFDGRKDLRDDFFLTLYTDVMEKQADAIKEHTSVWTIDMSRPGEVERKMEELVWTIALTYGIGGWGKADYFKADFFTMHSVTSSIFLPTVLAHLTPTSQELLLRAHFTICLTWWVARGRPRFDIPGFFAADTLHPAPSGPLPTPYEGSLPAANSPVAVTPNPWMPIIETSLVHPDDHLPKLQRALAHWGRMYGMRGPGMQDFARTELQGADVLDGSLFIRTAGLTAKSMGRMREGEVPVVFWDREGFYTP